MNAKNESGEKVAGTNLTTIPEYSETALALADLKHRYAGRVFESLETEAQRKEANKCVAEVRGYITALEAKRKEIKAPALERCRKIDSEAKRITAELSALEEPMKAQIDAKKAEIEAAKAARMLAEQQRIDGHEANIQKLRDFPLSLQGKPSSVIESRIEVFVREHFDTIENEHYEEFSQSAKDAYYAALHSARLVCDKQKEREAEQARLAELEAMAEAQRQKQEELERKLREAEEREALRVREEQERAEAAERAERERAEAAKEAERKEELRQQRLAEQARLEAQSQAQEAEAKRQREAAAELERQQREHAAQVERDRIAKLGLMDAVRAVVEYVEKGNSDVPRCILDLCEVYYALPVEKKQAAKPVKKAVQ
jgi:hypothetical protein